MTQKLKLLTTKKATTIYMWVYLFLEGLYYYQEDQQEKKEI